MPSGLPAPSSPSAELTELIPSAVPSRSSTRRGAGQAREGSGGQRDGEHGIGKQGHRLGVGEDVQGADAASVVGQPDDDEGGQLLTSDGEQASEGQRSDPATDAGREAQARAESDAGPTDGDGQGQRHRGHPEARAHPEDEDRPAWDRGDLGRGVRHERPVGEVSGDDDETGQERRERRGHEPPVRLEDPCEDDGDTVEGQLDGEDGQELGAEIDRRHLTCAEQGRGDRPGGEEDDGTEREQHGQRPGQQRRGRLVGGPAVCTRECSRHEGHRHGGQDATCGDLEDDVGDGVD